MIKKEYFLYLLKYKFITKITSLLCEFLIHFISI